MTSGSGATCAQPGRAGGGPATGLSREQIVRAAIAIADREGPGALSMRRIAAELGSGTMSLYWHVASKEDLLDLMLDEIFGELTLPARPSGDWRADMRLVAGRTRAVLQRHEWLASLLGGRPHLGPNALAQADFLLAILDGRGLSPAAMFSILCAIDDYVQGAVLREFAQGAARRRSGLTEAEWRDAVAPYLRGVLSAGDYPTLARFIDVEGELDDEARFAFGLECLLDGIAARVGGAGGEEASPPAAG